MNRYFGLSGLIHLALFGGVIYFCATYDYSSPYRMKTAEVEAEKVSAEAPKKMVATPPMTPISEEMAAPKSSLVKDLERKLRSQEALAEKAINKLPPTTKAETLEETKVEKALPLVGSLPPAKFAPRVEKVDMTEENLAQQEVLEREPVVTEPQPLGSQPVVSEDLTAAAPKAGEFEDKALANEALIAAEAGKASFADKTLEEKKALLARLKAINAQTQTAPTPEGAAARGVVILGSNTSEKASSEVRGVEQVKQEAGNPLPKYDKEDRLHGRTGTVVFQAYVDADGTPKDFELVESSGHRSLDLKTLKALKQWKFQAGQEGLVEIPFRWDLKGGPTELPSGLRKKLSQKQESIAK